MKKISLQQEIVFILHIEYQLGLQNSSCLFLIISAFIILQECTIRADGVYSAYETIFSDI